LLRSMAKGAVNQANINAQELQGIEVYVPNIELQHEFVAFKKQIDKSKLIFCEALEILHTQRHGCLYIFNKVSNSTYKMQVIL
ncbi:MAG: hypothetical protein MR290_05055, partial [Ruminococcus sp.]|nr:hypothetical protein [Ruminococcus sp.]